jgi:hypothetical protein
LPEALKSMSPSEFLSEIERLLEVVRPPSRLTGIACTSMLYR